MLYTEFNGTKVSKLCLGTMRMPKDAKGEIDFKKSCDIIDYSLEHGITYFDTAYTYLGGKAEALLKDALVARHDRKSFQIVTKLPTWLIKEDKDVKEKFEEQLARCGVDYFDFYLVHDIEKQWYENIPNAHIFEQLAEEKKAGRIGHIGASFHCRPNILRQALEAYGDIIEFVQLQINYLDWKYVPTDELYAVADEFGKTVVIMEPLRGGTLSVLPSEKARAILDEAGKEHNLSYSDFAFGWLEKLPRVGWILSGMNEIKQVEENIAFFSREEGLTDKEVKAAEDAGVALTEDIFVPCTKCKYCSDCPQEINISKIFSTYNEAAAKNFTSPWLDLKQQYLDLGHNAKDCIHCGNCESHCPQHLEIQDILQKIDEKYMSL